MRLSAYTEIPLRMPWAHVLSVDMYRIDNQWFMKRSVKHGLLERKRPCFTFQKAIFYKMKDVLLLFIAIPQTIG